MNPDPLLMVVAEECHVPVRCIRGPERWDAYCRARHIYSYVARQIYGDSFKDISVVLNRANHSTSVKGYARVAQNPQAFEPQLSRIMERVLRKEAT